MFACEHGRDTVFEQELSSTDLVRKKGPVLLRSSEAEEERTGQRRQAVRLGGHGGLAKGFASGTNPAD